MRTCRPTLIAFAMACMAGVALGVRLGDAARAAAGDAPAPKDPGIALADSFSKARDPVAALAALDSAAAAALAAGDQPRQCRYLAHRGLVLKRASKPRDAEQAYLEAERCALAVGDSTLLCEVLFRMAQCVDEQGRPPRAISMYQRVIATAQACGDRAYQARGNVYLARRELQAGQPDSARARLEAALLTLNELGLEKDVVPASMFLGLTSIQLGDYERARAGFLEGLAKARAVDDFEAQGTCLSNLGFIEMSRGDPSQAAAHWNAAYELLRAHDELRASTAPALNAANALCDLGRFDEARTRIEAVLTLCRERGFADREAWALTMLGQLARRQGQDHESARQCRAALALLRQTDAVERTADAVLGLAISLTRLDSAQAALSLLQAEGTPLLPRLPPSRRAKVNNEIGSALLALGRYDEALTVMRRGLSEVEGTTLGHARLYGLPLMAAAFEAGGHPDSALACLQLASEQWEAERSVPLDPEWREERGAHGAQVATQLARLTLSHPPSTRYPDRVRTAFDHLQRFKTRTLIERMVGPGADSARVRTPSASTVTLEQMQREILQDGELLYDAFVGPDCSVAFAVTRGDCRAIELPGTEHGLDELVDLYLAVVASPASQMRGGSGAAPYRDSASELAEKLFAGSCDLLAASRRVLFAADGVLNTLPLGQLPLPAPPAGAATDSASAAPSDGGTDLLLAGREVVQIPSATVLAELRRRNTASGNSDPPAAHMVLAFAGGAAGDGGTLAGAMREVRRMGKRYADVEVRTGARAGSSLDEAELKGYRLLHFAAHTRADDQHPWRSGIVLSSAPASELRGSASDPQEGVLRASQLASMRLGAQLVVLSGCESAGGLTLTGEGVLGLTSALLTAGVPAVLATLWPVEDTATARLMDEFYAQLAAGQTVASALRQAQLALRAQAATAHPFYWAGFVVVGDGDIRVPLRPRRPMPWALAASGVGILVAFAWGPVALRGKRGPTAPATPSPHRSPTHHSLPTVMSAAKPVSVSLTSGPESSVITAAPTEPDTETFDGIRE